MPNADTIYTELYMCEHRHIDSLNPNHSFSLLAYNNTITQFIPIFSLSYLSLFHLSSLLLVTAQSLYSSLLYTKPKKTIKMKSCIIAAFSTVFAFASAAPSGTETKRWNGHAEVDAWTPTNQYPAAATYTVTVGAGGKNVYSPNQVNAKKGDVIVFNFLAKNHTLTQSEFATPCTYNGGFDTGFNQFNPNNQSDLFDLKVRIEGDSKPLWFYCAQNGHCPSGMVFGINPGNKMDQFIAKAKALAPSTASMPPAMSSSAPPMASSSAAATSTVPTKSSTTAPRAVNGATDAIQTVTVGLNNGTTLRFDPPFLTGIAQGSRVHFDFRAVNHTLTESSFASPCMKLAGTDIDTNFNNANKGDVPNLHPFDFTFDSTRTRFFYCKQANGTPNSHCGKGMVFMINPTSPDQLAQFQAAAMATLPAPKVAARNAWRA